tara:strand:- start:1138 stop:2169 length:1032 start_codon:yes stop_codon:yes gene_type:complete
MTILEIKNRVYNDFVTSFKNAITPLKKSIFEVFSYTLASTTNLLYIYLDRVLADSFLTTCTQQRVLNYFAPLKNLSRKSATTSTGTARFTGVDGSIVPISTIIIYNEFEFITMASGTIASGYVDIVCNSVKSGTIYNTIGSVSLVLATPIIGVDNGVSSTSGFTGAIDEETIESLRTRTKQKFASPTNIDNKNFYKSLAMEISNVKAAFVSSIKNGAGTAGITILTYSNNGVPIQADIDAVEQYFIDKNAVPTYVQFEYFIPIIISQDFTIQLIINDLTNQTRIEQLIRDYLYLFTDPFTTFQFSNINDLLQANGARMNIPVDTGTIVLASDEILDIGTITWI